MIDWINNKYGTSLTDEDLQELKTFTLLWNIYENTLFDNSFSIDRLEQIITKKNLQIEYEVFIYFQNRYVENGTTNKRFSHLNFRSNDREELVRDVLTNVNTITNDSILAIGIIVYRFRSNLFHGLKNFREIGNQHYNFRNANIYLKSFLDS